MNLVPRLSICLSLTSCLLAGPVSLALAVPLTVTLHWTAPGDDGVIGRAFAYDVRYSLTPITASNFPAAISVPGVPAPQSAGALETFAVTNLVAGNGYYFAIKTVDELANWSLISNVGVYSPTLAADTDASSLTLWLSPPFPNPARASARWSYTLPKEGPVEIEAFDLAGRHVRSIARGWRGVGQGEVDWDLRDDGGRAIAAGIYLIRATLGGQTSMKRLIVIH